MNLYAAARLALGLLATVFMGWVFLRSVLKKEMNPFVFEVALSYGLGMAIAGFEFVPFWLINIKPTLLYIIVPWVVLFLVIVIASERSERSNPLTGRLRTLRDCFAPAALLRKAKQQGLAMTAVLKNISPFEISLLLGIALEVALSFLRALIKPIESFDSVAIYAIRSKIFYYAGGIPQNFFGEITKSYPNSSHPIMVPLFETWVYKILNNFDDFAVKIIFPLFFLALVILFYFSVRGFLNREKALLFTFILATIPQLNRFSAIGYADFPLTFYFAAGSISLFRALKEERMRYFILSAVLFGIACWIKMEGFALSLCAVIVALIWLIADRKNKGRYLKLGLFMLIILLIGSPWIALLKHASLESDVFKMESFGAGRFASSFFNLERLPRIIYEFQKQFSGLKKWNIVWIIFLALASLNIKSIFRNDIKYMTYLVFLAMAAYVYSFLLIPLGKGEPINIYLSTTVSRLFIHFTPLVVYWIAYLCKEKNYV